MGSTRIQAVRAFLGRTQSAEEFASWFCLNGRYRFGNAPLVTGRAAIQRESEEFHSKVRSITHDIKAIWEHEGRVAAEMLVTYVRADGKEVTLPCMSVFEFDGDLFERLSIYVDPAPIEASQV